MDKKKILIIVGVVAVIGIGYYMYNKSKKPAEGGAEGGAEAPTDATTKSAEAPADATATAQNIKDLKGKEKRDFRKGTRDVCKEKYGKGKDYRDCQKRVKGGGVAFDGSDFDQFEKDYIDFEGETDNQFMYSDFDNSLNLDL
jgi:hypothetical protein